MTPELDFARQHVDQFLQNYYGTLSAGAPRQLGALYEAMFYSVLQKGKRMRPLLALATCRALSHSGASIYEACFSRVRPFAAAVELIHTYSLIHDDLPAMDNDDFRRGLPTNHKKFGEAMAVLAGDGLQAQAFELLVESYLDSPILANQLVLLLSKACGPAGMVGGQALDILFRKNPELEGSDLEFLHSCKTGALIGVSVTGAALVAGAKPEQLTRLQDFSTKLGLAFQVADDIIDFAEQDQKIEGANFVSVLGLSKARAFCDDLITEAVGLLAEFGESAEWLKILAADVNARANNAVHAARVRVDQRTNMGELSESY